jgi:hypothetical protein
MADQRKLALYALARYRREVGEFPRPRSHTEWHPDDLARAERLGIALAAIDYYVEAFDSIALAFSRAEAILRRLDETYREVIHLTRAMRDEGRSYTAIARELNDKGYMNMAGHPIDNVLLSRLQDDHALLTTGRISKRDEESYARKLLPRVKKMRAKGMTAWEIAEKLNALGVASARGRAWTEASVSAFCLKHGLHSANRASRKEKAPCP